jgi:hypothetical protein
VWLRGSFQILRTAGADESAWLVQSEFPSENDSLDIPDESKISTLSTSSPAHQVIKAGNSTTLNRLLTRNYSSNYRPPGCSYYCLTPHFPIAIALCDLDDPGVQGCVVDLLAHPRLNPHLRTPIFDVHLLHFAAARHGPDLLTWLAGSFGDLHTAGITALGHTLLHIAALPLTANYTVARNPAVTRSIHCACTLDSKWMPHRLPSPLHMEFAFPRVPGPKPPRPLTATE